MHLPRRALVGSLCAFARPVCLLASTGPFEIRFYETVA